MVKTLISTITVRAPSPQDDKSSPEQNKTSSHGSWRVTVLLGAAIAVSVLIVNVAVLTWASHQGQDDPGVATVFTGPCARSKTITLWADLAVNVLSTLLLSASNNCAQLVAAPTRREIDKAHERREWLEVGVQSFRNLGYLPRWRGAIWLLLFLSSIPLHFL